VNARGRWRFLWDEAGRGAFSFLGMDRLGGGWRGWCDKERRCMVGFVTSWGFVEAFTMVQSGRILPSFITRNTLSSLNVLVNCITITHSLFKTPCPTHSINAPALKRGNKGKREKCSSHELIFSQYIGVSFFVVIKTIRKNGPRRRRVIRWARMVGTMPSMVGRGQDLAVQFPNFRFDSRDADGR